jgi:predicted DNA binding CopG/RHH family protein
MTRQVPRLTTDEEAEAFLEQDLSDLDFSQFKRVRFEFETKVGREQARHGREPDNEEENPDL